jgi:large subunit ribosomal protein L23
VIESRVYDVLVEPVVSEKATALTGRNKYVFNVSDSANKKTVKEAVEKVFNVKVVSVNILNRKGKEKVFKGRIGKRSDVKKAIVTIESGKTIELSVGV